MNKINTKCKPKYNLIYPRRSHSRRETLSYGFQLSRSYYKAEGFRWYSISSRKLAVCYKVCVWIISVGSITALEYINYIHHILHFQRRFGLTIFEDNSLIFNISHWILRHVFWTHWGLDQSVAISQTTFGHVFSWIKMNSLRISLKSVLKLRIINIPALDRIMAWGRPSEKSLSEPMIVYWRIYASLGLSELSVLNANLIWLKLCHGVS